MTENIHFKIEGGYQYNAYHQGICFQRSWHGLKYQKALELLDAGKNDTILDAACGSGVLTDLISKTSNANLTAVDFNEAAIRFCKSEYQHSAIKFLTLDLQEKYFDEHTFTKIVMLETIEHLTPETANIILKNLYAYLRPGGRLIISTPNKKSFWPAIEFILDGLRLTPAMKNEQHVKLYSRKSLQDVLEQAGFKVSTMQTTHFIAPWLSFFGLNIARKIHKAEQKVGILPGSLLFAVAEK